MPTPNGSPQPLSLHEAARLGDLAAIRRELDSGALIDVRDEDGRTALHLAARALEASAIEALLAAGAQVDAEDRWNCTPLWYAVLGPGGVWLAVEFEARRRPCVRALVGAGADPEHACRPPQFEGFHPQTPWARGGGVRGAFATAVPEFGVDPEFCAPDQPFDMRGGFSSDRSLWLDPRRVDACLGFARKHGIEHISVMSEVPEAEHDKLRELGRMPELRSVTVRNRKGDDLGWIEALDTIPELILLDRLRALDLSRFKLLRDLRVAWNARLLLPPIEAPLETLNFLHWTPKPSDLRCLKPWKTVRTFSVGLGSLASLDGIEVLENLERAAFSGLRNLVEVGMLASCRKLRYLKLDDCRRAVQLDVIRELKELEELVIVGRFKIASLRFVEDLPRLRNFRFLHVDVEDGDLTPLLGIEEPVFLPHKRHYSHTPEQFAELHAQRHGPRRARP